MKSRITNKNKQSLPQQYEQESEVFAMWLLFEEKPKRPDAEVLHKALVAKFGDTEIISSGNELSSFGIKKYTVSSEDGRIPAQIIMGNVTSFEQNFISEKERTQLRDVENPEEFLRRCHYKMVISDMMSGLDFKSRTSLLMDWLETVVALMPKCIGVWIPTGGKLISADFIRNKQIDDEDRFVCYCVNARFFNVVAGKEMLVDTHGMCALGKPDVQCHFHTLSPDNIVNYLYNIASFICQSDEKIKDNDTIDGFDGDEISEEVRWVCRYEDSMAQPMRPVIDINPGKYSAGNRE